MAYAGFDIYERNSTELQVGVGVGEGVLKKLACAKERESAFVQTTFKAKIDGRTN